ncbi:hypothetical protein NIES970_29230 (plasmid) [[Synechococcus] sp. NIES-970]|nr:hypothetical protein NIES970_29230 [[Synechococcus] sp. NIES-970]
MAKSKKDKSYQEHRKKLIRQISNATGVAGYALDKKLSDEEVSTLLLNLEAIHLLKKSVNYNRYCQAQKTRKANERLKQFLDIKESEILNTGKKIFETLGWIPKKEHDKVIADVKDGYSEIEETFVETIDKSQEIIEQLQVRIDRLRYQQSSLRDYVKFNYGDRAWKEIQNRFNLENLDD